MLNFCYTFIMILNVSGRTDIVAFYSKWFMNRYNEGYVDVRNPFYPKLVSRIYFDDVDLIVFCTKNPIPILNDLNKINKPIIFQVTLTPYGKDIEPNVIFKGNIINAIKKLSNILGTDNVYVRYDPILINDRYDVNFHIKSFKSLCVKLNGYVKHVIVSFIDDYKNVRNNISILKLNKIDDDIYKKIGENFSKIALDNGMTVQTCYEKNNLSEYGFISNPCVSKELALSLTGKKFSKWKARNCGCVEMVDIGVYNTCKHFCKYCYANFDENKVLKNIKKHDDTSSLLIGYLKNDDVIKVRKK